METRGTTALISALSALPSETMLHIFGSLSAQELATVSRVCKCWKDVAEADMLWKTLYMKRFPHRRYELQAFSWKEFYVAQTRNIRRTDVIELKGTFKNSGTAENLSIALDENTLALRKENGTIEILDTLNGKHLGSFPCDHQNLSCIDMQDNMIVAGSKDGKVKGWDLQSRTCLHDLSAGFNVKAIVIEEDMIVAAGTSDQQGVIKGWNRHTGQELFTLQDSDKVSSLAVKQGTVVTGSSNGMIKVWDLSTRAMACSLECDADKEKVRCVAIGEHTIAAIIRFQLVLWNRSTRECLPEKSNLLTTAVAIKDGIIISTELLGAIRLQNEKTAELIQSTERITHNIEQVAIQGNRIVLMASSNIYIFTASPSEQKEETKALTTYHTLLKGDRP
jgi:hypothetical protein